MASQPKTPLKVVGSGSNFHRKLNLYQGIKLHWSGPLEGHIKKCHFPGCGAGLGPPHGGSCQISHNVANLEPLINFMHVLTINEDILGAIGTLHV